MLLGAGAGVPADVLLFARVSCAGHAAVAGALRVARPAAAGRAGQSLHFAGRVRGGRRAGRAAEKKTTNLVPAAGRVALPSAADRAWLGALQLAPDRAFPAACFQTRPFAGIPRRP